MTRRYQRAGHDCSDGFRDALDEDGLAELGVGVGGLAGRNMGDVEGLDLGQLGLGPADLDAEHGGVLGGLAGVVQIQQGMGVLR